MKIKTVCLFHNGMVAVFDDQDKQIPELQGCIFNVLSKIEEHADADTEFWYGRRDYPVITQRDKLDLAWYFERKKELLTSTATLETS